MIQDLNKNLLRYHQREELKNEITSSEEMLKHAKPDERGVIVAGLNRTKKQLESQSPTPLTGPEKDKLYKLEKQLREKLTHGMPTQEVMRKNPPGAVDWHMKWEKKFKKLIRMWKNSRIQLNPDSSDRDLANLERYRPTGQTDRMRADAQIPGLMSYTNVPDENWEAIFDIPQNTALAQAQRHYDEGLAEDDVNKALDEVEDVEIAEAALDEHEEKQMTPDEIILRQKRIENLKLAREVRKQQREAEKQLSETLQADPV